jgi:Flp pilus assembly protein TadB
MTIVNDPNLWVIGGLLFILGLLIGMFMTAGGRRKWKARYNEEISRRQTLERTHKEREADFTAREKMREAELATREREWREQDSLRGAAVKGRGTTSAVDVDTRRTVAGERTAGDADGDGVPNRDDDRPLNKRRS